jgi:hypothetical protein
MDAAPSTCPVRAHLRVISRDLRDAADPRGRALDHPRPSPLLADEALSSHKNNE